MFAGKHVIPVVGIPNYTVSDDGHVYVAKTGQEISQRVSDKGYPVVSLRLNKKAVIRQVHSLVLLAFAGGPPDDDQSYSCDHRDRNRQNNHIQNLRWATAQQQVQNSAICLEIGKMRAALYRPVITTCVDGDGYNISAAALGFDCCSPKCQ